MNESRPAAQALMACLGEESRFRLVQALIGGARCVTELAAEVGLSQSCTTRHLQALERRDVVRGTREGKRVLYRLRDEDPGLMPLLGWALRAQIGTAAVQPAAGPQRRPPVRQGPADRRRSAAPPLVRRPRGGDEAPAPEVEPGRAEAVEPTPPPFLRPRRESDIEDFLL